VFPTTATILQSFNALVIRAPGADIEDKQMRPAETALNEQVINSTTEPTNKFHIELHLTQKELQEIEAASTALAVTALAAYELKSGKLSSLAFRIAPLVEDTGMSLWAASIKAAKLAPKTNYFDLKNGLEVTFDRNVSLFSKTTDMVSIVDHLGNEAHLYASGSRTVVRATAGSRFIPTEFYDQAGVGIHVPVNHSELPSVVFENSQISPKNLQLYKKVSNAFWTGNKRPLDRMPNLLDQASNF